jgi:hypothetical protein
MEMGLGNQLSMPLGKRSRSVCQGARYEVFGKKPIIPLDSLGVKYLTGYPLAGMSLSFLS